MQGAGREAGGAHQIHQARRSGIGAFHGASTSSVVPILPTASRKVVDHQSKPRVALTCWFTTATSTQKRVSAGRLAASSAETTHSKG